MLSNSLARWQATWVQRQISVSDGCRMVDFVDLHMYLIRSLKHVYYTPVKHGVPQWAGFLWRGCWGGQQKTQSRTEERPASWSPGTQPGPSHTLTACVPEWHMISRSLSSMYIEQCMLNRIHVMKWKWTAGSWWKLNWMSLPVFYYGLYRTIRQLLALTTLYTTVSMSLILS